MTTSTTRADRADEERRKDALARWLCAQITSCTFDELRVIAVRVERMAKARPHYGGLDLANDPRDFKREAAEENIDRGFYLDCLLVKRQDEERDRLRCEAADELARTNPVAKGLEELRDSKPVIGRAPAVDFAFDHSEAGEDKL